MAGASFHFESRGIGKLLADGGLNVPPNQRSYAWDEAHVIDLLRDVSEAIDSDEDEYFLGTVVLVTSDTGLSIADGQQRLATTTILLARLRDELQKLGRGGGASSTDATFIRSMDRDTEQVVPHLSLNLEDNEFFSSVILATPEESLLAKTPAARNSNQKLRRASEAVSDFLQKSLVTMREDARSKRLLEWVTFLEKRALVGVVTVPDDVGAFRIFETLNDRGLRASQADILKNFLLSKAGNRFVEANTFWQSIVTQIEAAAEDDGDGLVTFIRHYWITREGPTKERELAGKIRSEIKSQAKTLKFLSDAQSASRTYVALSSRTHPMWSAYPASVARAIGVIQDDLRIRQIKPLLFAVALRFSPQEAVKALELMVSWSVRFLVVGGRGGMLDEQYSRRASEVGLGKISTARELREAMAKYVPKDDEFQQAFAVARVSRSYIARYYLREIERARSLGGKQKAQLVPNDDLLAVNLEHVLPISPSKDWKITAEESEAAQSMIGNLALMASDANAKVGNGSFSAKKAILSASNFSTTSEIAAYQNWTIAEIRQRQAKLAEEAVKVWTLTF